MSLPLVSVICVCFNHEKYLEESLRSVLNQTYPNIEMIVVDDASSDKSPQLIQDFEQKHPFVKTILLTENQGNCRAFNLGFAQSRGKYVIDLATDDVLLPQRIASQVSFFEKLDECYGVIFSDAFLIDFAGNITRTFYLRNSSRKLVNSPSQNDIYEKIIAQSYICSPTMMIRRKVLEELGGYDEQLSYEDYDFWVRSSRKYLYGFQDEILTSKRILKHSHGQSFYKTRSNPHLLSTLKVHEKAFLLNKNSAENRALARSVRYHLRLAFYTENFELLPFFANLLRKMHHFRWVERIFVQMGKHRISVNKLYQFYQRVYSWSKKMKKTILFCIHCLTIAHII